MTQPRMPVRRAIARLYFRGSRWTLVREDPAVTGSRIILGAPHTSNWDFVLMLAIAWSHGISPRFLGKHQLFQGPGGWIMRRLGGIPVDRSDPSRIVDEVIALIASGEEIQLVVTPEGTRGAGTHWRSGFHRISVATGLPVTLGYPDITTETAGLGPTLVMTGDVTTDMDAIRAFYADKAGVRPELRTEPRFRSEDDDVEDRRAA